ncbi:MAG: TolC family protein [Sandaracinaceae bacterium]
MSRRLSVLALLLVGGCAARYESDTRHALRAATRAMQQESVEQAGAPGTLASYVTRALADRPRLQAELARWRAATLRIEAARRIPEPTVTYGFYALPVQTRVGPQRHRVSIRQTLPWPTQIGAAADAQSARARASQRRFEARALGVRREVADAWWSLWLVRRSRIVLEEQASLVAALAESQRGQLEVGRGSLADVAQVELAQTRLQDRIAGLDPEEHAAEARLRAATGLGPDVPVPTTGNPPRARRPSIGEARLREAVATHPFVAEFALRAEAAREQAGVEEAARFPRLMLGADWIETGAAAMPVDGSGQDALIVSVGLSVPLYQDSYGAAQRAAEADATAFEADGQDAVTQALGELAAALSALEDARRRSETYTNTMLPQATEVYASVLGAVAVGEAPLAAALLATRDRLEIGLMTLRARADHGRAWARLEAIVGHPVPAREAETP